MPITKIAARSEVRSDIDRIALQRGPLVYCVEGADNKESLEFDHSGKYKF